MTDVEALWSEGNLRPELVAILLSCNCDGGELPPSELLSIAGASVGSPSSAADKVAGAAVAMTTTLGQCCSDEQFPWSIRARAIYFILC